jgi:phage tail sheath gpL-like
MAIRHSIPATKRRPGVYVEFNVLAAARGLVPIQQRLALIGAKLPAGTQPPLVPVQCFTTADGDRLFGAGSELALMVRHAIAAAALYGSSPELWAVALDDPLASAAAQRTITFTGTAQASGNARLRIAGRPIVAPVQVNDDAAAVAQSVLRVVQGRAAILPVEASAAAGVVTLVARNAGENGNVIRVEVDELPTGLGAAVADTVVGVGAYDLTDPLDTLIDKTYQSVAVANHTAADVAALIEHAHEVGTPSAKAWTTCYVAETGTLATQTALAVGANDMAMVVIGAEDFPNTPGEIAATFAATIEAEADPALSFDGVELPLYPPPIASVPGDAEIEAALAAGASILTVNPQRSRAVIVRAVTTKTTEAGAPFEDLLDLTTPRSLYFVGTQIDTAIRIAFQRAKKNERTKKRARSVALGVLRKAEEIEVLQNVEAHRDELVVEDDPAVPTRLVIGVPTSVVPPLHQVVPVLSLLVE